MQLSKVPGVHARIRNNSVVNSTVFICKHLTPDTRHTTHDTRHTTHDTRHTTPDTRHSEHLVLGNCLFTIFVTLLHCMLHIICPHI